MRRIVLWRLAIIPLVVGCIYLWVRTHNYIRAINSISSEVISQSNYSELPKLVRNIPGTKTIFMASGDSYEYLALRGNEKVKRIYRSRDKVMVDLRFTDKEDDADKRSATVTKTLGGLNLTNTILFTSVQVRGDIVGQGHQKSRIQLELADVAGRTMMGPKLPINSSEVPLIIRPTTSEPIPTGSFKDGFDLTRVESLTVRFIIGRYPDEIKIPANGKLVLSDIFEITRLDLVSKAFRKPELNRLTKDGLNLGYELRKLKWKTENTDFFVGVNYPWNKYGWDIGKNPYGLPENSGWSANEKKLANDFTELKNAGVSVIRIYIFFDLRTGLEYKDGQLVGFDPYVRKDIETVFRVAGKIGIKIIPVLFDFGNEHSELIFYSGRANFLINIVRPLLIDMDRWNDKYGGPVLAVEVMNEPDNMAMLLVPGYFESLKVWFKDLANIIHQETKFKVTLGSHSIVDMQRWWSDIPIDVWQFHFYKYMSKEHEWWPQNLKRDKIKMPGMVFCGELEPYDIKNNLGVIKTNGYGGVLFWSWNTNDGFKLSSEQLSEISEWIKSNQKEVK